MIRSDQSYFLENGHTRLWVTLKAGMAENHVPYPKRWNGLGLEFEFIWGDFPCSVF